MNYRIQQPYREHTDLLEKQCPLWVKSAVSDGNAEAFAVVDADSEEKTVTGYLAVNGSGEEADLLCVNAVDEYSFQVLFRRFRQYLKEHAITTVVCHEMVSEERRQSWEKLLNGQHFVLETPEKFYEISLEDIGKCSLFAQNETIRNAAEKGRIRNALGTMGEERKSLKDLMLRTHPDKGDLGRYGRAFPQLSGIYVHNHKVLAYLFISVYKGCMIVEECAAEKGMDALLLALMNHFVPEILREFPDSKNFYIPEDGDLMRYELCRKMILNKNLEIRKASLCHAYWNQNQAFAMREVQDFFLVAEAAQEDAGEDAVVISRTQQLVDILDGMQQENLLVLYEGRPAIQLWMEIDGEEVNCYLRYSLMDANQGKFVLEALVPLNVCADEAVAAELCMNYNRDRIITTLFWKEERFYMRACVKEYDIPETEKNIRMLLDDIASEWEIYCLVTAEK